MFGHTGMINKADVIVIGSGGLGAATAYYLSQRKGLSVALIDKHDIGSQTSPRAAGMVSCARKSDLMISLIKDACRKIEAFTEETGQPLDWVHSGSLKIARRPQDAEVIKADFERGRRMGLDVELISPERASLQHSPEAPLSRQTQDFRPSKMHWPFVFLCGVKVDRHRFP
jgi:4-methylaminobutanoate oxidase (formaldehyde-forming)